MKKTSIMTKSMPGVVDVICDLTGRSCKTHDGEPGDENQFEFAELGFSGGYDGDYDLLNFVLHIHPSIAVGMYAATLQDEERRALEERYKFPKVRILVEE